jgi:hypothetical protein
VGGGLVNAGDRGEADEIGAIDIDSRTTSFEVAESVAHQFERSAGMRDSRDPHLQIRRARSGRR